jgi:hypothetical protein
MKQWAWLVAALYVLVLVVLTFPACMAAFAPEIKWAEALNAYASWGYWAWLVVMFVGEFALLAVPVQVVSRRPVTKGALWPTVLAGGLMAGALLVGAIYSILEFIFGQRGAGPWPWVAIAAGVLLWVVWSAVFFRLGGRVEPTDLVSRQCRLLLKGSILELLIAVPTHIVARYRNYCCAGLMTFIGLTMGISVMLFAFGPAVFFLYADRWKQLRPKARGVSVG